MDADSYSDDRHQIQLLGFDQAIEECLVFATLGLEVRTKSWTNYRNWEGFVRTSIAQYIDFYNNIKIQERFATGRRLRSVEKP